jgi:hypothetical protein
MWLSGYSERMQCFLAPFIPLAAGHIFGPVLSHVILPNFSESFSNSSEDTASKRLKYRQIQELSTTTRYFLNFS